MGWSRTFCPWPLQDIISFCLLVKLPLRWPSALITGFFPAVCGLFCVYFTAFKKTNKGFELNIEPLTVHQPSVLPCDIAEPSSRSLVVRRKSGRCWPVQASASFFCSNVQNVARLDHSQTALAPEPTRQLSPLRFEGDFLLRQFSAFHICAVSIPPDVKKLALV